LFEGPGLAGLGEECGGEKAEYPKDSDRRGKGE
jgi:hypothetical protein